jgi:hypothetical protein
MPPVEEKTEFASPEERGDIVAADATPEEVKPAEATPDEVKAEEVDVKADEAKTDEAKDEGKTSPPEEKSKGYKVPKFRLDAATARAKRAEEEAEQLRQRLAEAESKPAATPAPAEPELDAESKRDAELERVDKELADAMANQDTKRVAALMSEARQIEREFLAAQLQETSQQTSQQTTAEVRETMRVNAVLDQLEQQFPAFDENSDEYNQELNDKVLELQQAYMATGRNQSDALIEAVNIALPAFGYQVEEVEAAPEPAQDKKTDVKRNAAVANQQPPRLDSVGDDSTAAGQTGSLPDGTLLTEKEFDALPEDTKKRMRGDFI